MLAGAAPAAASPDHPPTEPVPGPPVSAVAAPPPAPPPAGIGNPLAQAGTNPAGPFGLPDLSDYASNLILGQNPAPAAPGNPDPAAVPSLNAFDPEYLLAQNEDPAEPGQGVIAPGMGPTPDDPGTGRIAFLRRLHEMYQHGTLDGALLGQVPLEQWGEVPLEQWGEVPPEQRGEPPTAEQPEPSEDPAVAPPVG